MKTRKNTPKQRLGAIAHQECHRTATLTRLRRVEGQVRGLQKMVEDGRYCADVLIQISAVQQALQNTGREVLRQHLRHCAAAAMKGGGDKSEAMADEIVSLFEKYGR